MKDRFDQLFEQLMSGYTSPLNTTMGNPGNKQSNPLAGTMGNSSGSSDPTGAADPGASTQRQVVQQAAPSDSESEDMANVVVQAAMGDVEKIINSSDPNAAAGIVRTALAGDPMAAKNVASYIEKEPGNWENFQTTLRNKLGQLSNMSQSFRGAA